MHVGLVIEMTPELGDELARAHESLRRRRRLGGRPGAFVEPCLVDAILIAVERQQPPVGDRWRGRARSRPERTFPMQDTLGDPGSGTAVFGSRPPPPVLAFFGNIAGGRWCRRADSCPCPRFPETPMMGAAVGFRFPENRCDAPVWFFTGRDLGLVLSLRESSRS
jgi:hypothetical protein